MKKRPKKSVGRPSLPDADKRMPLGIPFSPAERELIRQAADAVSLPLTVFVRQVVLQHIKGS